MRGIEWGEAPRSRRLGSACARFGAAACALLSVAILLFHPAYAAPERLDDEIPDAQPSLDNGISASYGFSSLNLDGPQNSERTWHNYFKLKYQFSDDIGLRVFYDTHELAGGFGMISPLYDGQDEASAYGFDLSMNMLNVDCKTAKQSSTGAFEAGSSFNIGVTGKQTNIDAANIGQSDQQLGAYLAYSTDLTDKMRAHTYFSTGRFSGDSHTGSVNRVGAGLDYTIQRGRHPLVLMANGVLDIYNFRQPSFNTSRISRFDVGLRYKIRQGIYASAGLITLNDSDNDASGSGIFAGLNYVDEDHDWGELGDPLAVQPPPPPPPPPTDTPPPPPPPQASAGQSTEVVQAPLMASNAKRPAGQSPQSGAAQDAAAVPAGSRHASSALGSEQAADATGSSIGRPVKLDQAAYTDPAMLDSGLYEKVDGGAYYYDPDLAASNDAAARAVPDGSRAGTADETAGRPAGAVVAELVDANGVAVPAFPLSSPEPTSGRMAMVRPPLDAPRRVLAESRPAGKRAKPRNDSRPTLEQQASTTSVASDSASVDYPDTAQTVEFGLTPREGDELSRLLAQASGAGDEGSVLVLQREAVLGPAFGRVLNWPLTREAHIEVLADGWVSYSNFDAEE